MDTRGYLKNGPSRDGLDVVWPKEITHLARAACRNLPRFAVEPTMIARRRHTPQRLPFDPPVSNETGESRIGGPIPPVPLPCRVGSTGGSAPNDFYVRRSDS